MKNILNKLKPSKKFKKFLGFDDFEESKEEMEKAFKELSTEDYLEYVEQKLAKLDGNIEASSKMMNFLLIFFSLMLVAFAIFSFYSGRGDIAIWQLLCVFWIFQLFMKNVMDEKSRKNHMSTEKASRGLINEMLKTMERQQLIIDTYRKEIMLNKKKVLS